VNAVAPESLAAHEVERVRNVIAAAGTPILYLPPDRRDRTRSSIYSPSSRQDVREAAACAKLVEAPASSKV
jgi:hypothetical protein